MILEQKARGTTVLALPSGKIPLNDVETHRCMSMLPGLVDVPKWHTSDIATGAALLR